jgi:hypothetical protein
VTRLVNCWRITLAAAVLAVVTGACSAPTACPVDPSPAATSMATCTSPSLTATCGTFDAVVALSDYTSSQVGLFSVNTPSRSNYATGIDLGADPVLASSAGRFFWIARDFGQIIELDTSCLHAVRSFNALDPTPDCSPPPPTDPYDVAVAPDGALWIARFDVPTVLVLDACGSRLKTIDLSSLDPEDGNPNMNSIRIIDSAAYVSLEILDDHSVPPLASTRPSKLVRIDLETGAITDVLTLAGRNPLSSIVQVGKQLYLADAGNWCPDGGCPAGQPDAGVEVVDTASFTSKLLVTGTALGGHASSLAVTESCGVVIVAGAYPETPTSLVQFDPTGKASSPIRTLIPTTGSFTLGGLAWVGEDVLLVGDGGTAGGTPGVRVFDAELSSGCSLTQRPAELPLPQAPVAFAALR